MLRAEIGVAARRWFGFVPGLGVRRPDDDGPALSRIHGSRTEEYYEALGRSRYVISNDDMPGNYMKRDGQVYVQTWQACWSG